LPNQSTSNVLGKSTKSIPGLQWLVQHVFSLLWQGEELQESVLANTSIAKAPSSGEHESIIIILAAKLFESIAIDVVSDI